jgi:hypothetical protein
MRLFKHTAAMIFMTTAVCTGQTVYTLTPATKGNEIALTVVNTSSKAAAASVAVRVVRHPDCLIFTPSTQQPDQPSTQRITRIMPGSEATASFTFDVDRPRDISRNDTEWRKHIIVNYAAPVVFHLEQNFPNPFNPTTTIRYELPFDSKVYLSVFDILGREVRTLVNEERKAGYYDVQWHALNVASGVYFYRLEALPLNGGPVFSHVRKMMVLR